MTLDLGQALVEAAIGISAAAIAKVTGWRLRALEHRMGRAEQSLNEVQQRTASLRALVQKR